MKVNCSTCLNFASDNQLLQYFIDIIETKDPYTQGHSHHVRAITEAIYESLPLNRRNELHREKLFTAALLHDIGKIRIPDTVLNKAGKLSETELKIMAGHPQYGKELLAGTVFQYLGDWILYHHERMDGSGYYGIPGEMIPVESRIIAVADTFSALRTYRVYRPARTLEETSDIMRAAAGHQLDPEILECFLSLKRDFLENLECRCEICRRRREALKQKQSGENAPPAFQKVF